MVQIENTDLNLLNLPSYNKLAPPITSLVNLCLTPSTVKQMYIASMTSAKYSNISVDMLAFCVYLRCVVCSAFYTSCNLTQFNLIRDTRQVYRGIGILQCKQSKPSRKRKLNGVNSYRIEQVIVMVHCY